MVEPVEKTLPLQISRQQSLSCANAESSLPQAGNRKLMLKVSRPFRVTRVTKRRYDMTAVKPLFITLFAA